MSEVARQQSNGKTQSVTCDFSPPVTVVAWPPKVGARFSGSGKCGSISVAISGDISGTAQMSIDNTHVATYVVDTRITFEVPSPVVSTETDSYDPSSGLNLKEVITEHAGTGSNVFSSSAIRILESRRPH